MLPSFSTEEAAGRRKTSVLIFLGSIPGPFQKELVSFSKRSISTIQSNLANAFRVLSEFGLEQAGFIPKQMNPENLPLNISSNMKSQEAFCPTSNFGSHPYPKSFSLVAFSPKNDLSRLAMYLGLFPHQLTLMGSDVFGVVALYFSRFSRAALGWGR